MTKFRKVTLRLPRLVCAWVTIYGRKFPSWLENHVKPLPLVTVFICRYLTVVSVSKKPEILSTSLTLWDRVVVGSLISVSHTQEAYLTTSNFSYNIIIISLLQSIAGRRPPPGYVTRPDLPSRLSHPITASRRAADTPCTL